MPDVVYAVRRNERNESLRLSLRSLGNLPHRRVFIAGYCPSWVKNVTEVPVIGHRANKFDSIQHNVLAALEHPDLSDQFVYFNDDFYVMEPIDEVPVLNGGPVEEYRGMQELKIRMRQTMRVLDRPDVLLFDGVHVPMPVHRDAAYEILKDFPRGILWRTLYGNLTGMTGERTGDVKSRHGEMIDGPFLSTNSRSLVKLRSYLEDVLPRRCPYV